MPTLTTHYTEDKLFETKIGNHTLVFDNPTAVGGQDKGPTPVSAFIAALASCITGMTAYYCQQSGIDSTDLSVDVSFDRADKPYHLVNLRVKINLPHADCKGRDQAILNAAAHCPVHQTIVGLGATPAQFELATPPSNA
jgi:putative redox protein